MKIAFLIIDLQSVYVTNKVSQTEIDQACEVINYVSDLLRSKEHLVIHVQDVDGRDGTNREQYEFISEVNISGKDLTVEKVHSNAFWQTDLEQILRGEAVDLVVLSGFAAEHCVLFTYNGARERGFQTVILQRGVLAENADSLISMSRDRNLISYPVIKGLV
ncbi:cysteine hydrolase family protein [Paenibacillus sp. GCM10027627]|uniref:cysteine hydrolase family protein n=1 Tax=unclassified Paenibacillus TaxID=185978 RepID=UPI003632725A